MQMQNKIDNIRTELENFTCIQVRGTQYNKRQLTLNIRYDSKFYVQDSEGLQFSIEGTQLQKFRQKIQKSKQNQIILDSWEFDLKFNGLNLESININGLTYGLSIGNDSAVSIFGALRISIFPYLAIQKLNSRTRGYINRIGKKRLIKNTDSDFSKLINFIPDTRTNIKNIQEPQKKRHDKKNETVNYNFISQLNESGLKILEKIQHVLLRQDIYSHMINLQLKDLNDYRYIRRMANPEQQKE